MDRRFVAILIMFVTVWASGTAQKPEQYDKHVIVVMDQTLSSNANTMRVYNVLKAMLLNQPVSGIDKSKYMLPDDFTFNPDTDELSLFGFALPTANFRYLLNSNSSNYTKYGGPLCNASESFNYFVDKFIESEGSFRSSNLSKKEFEYFLETQMKRLLQCNTQLSQRWEIDKTNATTLSYYIYPTILRCVNADVPASQFILIIISDYQSGANGESAIKDEVAMRGMVGDERYEDVSAMIRKIGEPFVRTDYIDFTINNLRAKGYKLLIKKTVQKSPIFISGGITPIKQVAHEGLKYDVQSAKVLFIKDDNTYVEKVKLNIYKSDRSRLIHTDSLSWDYNQEQNTYTVDGIKSLDLGSSSAQDMVLDYVFYTVSKDDAGNNIMPYVLTATRNVSKEEFEMNEGNTMKIIIALAIALILLVIAELVRRHRGKKRDAIIDYRINRVSKMHYMDVKQDEEQGLHVLNYDCWYVHDGDHETKIHVNGTVKLMQKAFAKNYKVRLLYKVEDLDQNYDFTFRPDGHEKNGVIKRDGKYYIAKMDDSGNFEFDVVSYIDRDANGTLRNPDFEKRENILKLGVYLKAQLVSGVATESDLDDNAKGVISVLAEVSNEAKPYIFIVKPNIENRSLWMAFDPGTSGSCVAFGNGGNPDDANIQLGKNLAIMDGVKGWWPIIPSYILVHPQHSTLNKIERGETLEYGTDFDFGNEAYQRDTESNRFQSIKKLLGYKTKLKVYGKDDRVVMIEGRELAHLIIQGLLNNFERFLNENTDESTVNIKPRFMPHGVLQPSRAIVAVPNNYTLTKVRDMVDSIKRTGKFREVHYLYESEGVMMSYMRKNWKSLVDKQDFTFVVFDMGGATINATAFRLKVNREVANSGTSFTRDVEVTTVSKIGYCVGGDDIDYAIMQVLYNIPEVKAAFGSVDAEVSKKQRKHQIDNKPSVLKFAEQVKKYLIDRENARKEQRKMKSGNIFLNNETLWNEVCRKFGEWGINIPQTKDDEGNIVVPEKFKKYIEKELSTRKTMERYVFNKVRDAVMELLKNNQVKGTKVELIFSGRSTLYPGISTIVLKEIQKECKCNDRWHGFDIDGKDMLDPDKVKTAVAEGACWYAMFSGYVSMKHDIVTSTFGYIDMVDDESTFIPVIERNTGFEASGTCTRQADVKVPNLQNIKFIQMLGSNYQEIYKGDIRHKMNPLVEVTADHIDGQVRQVEITVDDKNNFGYKLTFNGQEPIDGHYEAADTDIKDENSEEYIFAITQPEKRPEPVRPTGGTRPLDRHQRGKGL